MAHHAALQSQEEDDVDLNSEQRDDQLVIEEICRQQMEDNLKQASANSSFKKQASVIRNDETGQISKMQKESKLTNYKSIMEHHADLQTDSSQEID